MCAWSCCPTLCDPMNCSLSGSSVHGIFQARILEWVATSSSRGSSWPRDWTYVSCVSCIAGDYLSLSMEITVQFSHSAMSDSLWPHGLQHARSPCPSPTPGIYPNSGPSSRWCHPTISFSVIPFSSCLQSFPASESFSMSQLFAPGGQKIGVSTSTSILPMNTQDWSPLGCTGSTSLQSKGLPRVFSNTTVQKHQFFGAQLSL